MQYQRAKKRVKTNSSYYSGWTMQSYEWLANFLVFRSGEAEEKHSS
jgi:hypothetical protein